MSAMCAAIQARDSKFLHNVQTSSESHLSENLIRTVYMYTSKMTTIYGCYHIWMLPYTTIYGCYHIWMLPYMDAQTLSNVMNSVLICIASKLHFSDNLHLLTTSQTKPISQVFFCSHDLHITSTWHPHDLHTLGVNINITLCTQFLR